MITTRAKLLIALGAFFEKREEFENARRVYAELCALHLNEDDEPQSRSEDISAVGLDSPASEN